MPNESDVGLPGDAPQTQAKTPTTTPPTEKKDSAFLNLIFNIAIPVFILNKGSKYMGPGGALLVALAFPLIYGGMDLYRRHKVNFFSILGLVNVSITGGLAVLGLGGMWFAIKEAAFPLLIGAFVAGSALTKKPFIQTLIVNPSTMHWELVEQKLRELGREHDFLYLLKRTTWLLAASFLVSATLNFVLAVRIFLPIDGALSETERATVLNEQIAEMTTIAFAVTFVPSMLILSGILFYLFRGMTKTTGLTLEQIMK